jgi:hypothetical protein
VALSARKLRPRQVGPLVWAADVSEIAVKIGGKCARSAHAIILIRPKGGGDGGRRRRRSAGERHARTQEQMPSAGPGVSGRVADPLEGAREDTRRSHRLFRAPGWS